MKRYAILAGVSQRCGFQQKSLCDIYDFLKSSSGGAWSDREILILPEGVDEAMLKFILRRVAEDGMDFLFMYFCGNADDWGNADGFTVGGEKIERIHIEETCKSQMTVFDACEALVPVDDDFEEENEEAFGTVRNDRACDFCREDTSGENSVLEKQQVAAARILSDEAFLRVKGSLWLNGCGEGGKPLLGEDGCGLYTGAFLEGLCTSEGRLDFFAADRNGRFLCDVLRVGV
ncbi:hypothetical protein, partial [Treponema berlinense]|uniref:hypothetical protein n=1 Tax=Treponema berlinense TaxID=225004 RepID=UPI0026EE5E31